MFRLSDLLDALEESLANLLRRSESRDSLLFPDAMLFLNGVVGTFRTWSGRACSCSFSRLGRSGFETAMPIFLRSLSAGSLSGLNLMIICPLFISSELGWCSSQIFLSNF